MVLDVGIARFADFMNFAIFDADVGFNNAPPVEN
jgi:hypothetical protein